MAVSSDEYSGNGWLTDFLTIKKSEWILEGFTFCNVVINLISPDTRLCTTHIAVDKLVTPIFKWLDKREIQWSDYNCNKSCSMELKHSIDRNVIACLVIRTFYLLDKFQKFSQHMESMTKPMTKSFCEQMELVCLFFQSLWMIANKVRSLVSKEKIRFKEDGFDLDLTCKNFIAKLSFCRYYR